MNIIDTIKNAVAPDPIEPSAEDLRAALATHDKMVREVYASSKWVSEFENEAAQIERDAEAAKRTLSAKPTREDAERLVAALGRLPRAEALRLAVRIEDGRASNPARATQTQSVRALLQSVTKHAEQTGNDEARRELLKRESEISWSPDEAERTVRRYIAAATDRRREVEKPGERKPVNCGWRQ